jgi:tetratricopeptide (TPR) repeat protein
MLSMILTSRSRLLLATSATVVLLGITTGCAGLKARDRLNKGVSAFKGAKYSDAVTNFKEAIELDPSFDQARLYLATAYMQQWIPGADSPENKAMAANAEEQFKKVLDKDPANKIAIESIASLRYNEAQAMPTLAEKQVALGRAKEWYAKLLQVDPQNSKAHYSLGVIAWADWYPALKEARNKLGMKDEDLMPLKDKAVRTELKNRYSATIEEGLSNLNKAITIDPEYDDAMAYINLLTREKADLAEDAAEYKKLTEEADGWVAKALEARKIKAKKLEDKNKGAVVAE